MEQDANLVHRLLQAVLNENSSLQQQRFNELDERLLVLGEVADDVFETLSEAIRNPPLQASENSAFLLKLVEYNADLLTERQKKDLLVLLEEVYENFKDPASCILIVEIIADLSTNESSIDALSRLRTVKADFPRSVVVYGLKYLAKKTDNPDVFQRARAEILQMKTDASKLVRAEVDKSLSQLKTKGG